jgi:hypothetical protein
MPVPNVDPVNQQTFFAEQPLMRASRQCQSWASIHRGANSVRQWGLQREHFRVRQGDSGSDRRAAWAQIRANKLHLAIFLGSTGTFKPIPEMVDARSKRSERCIPTDRVSPYSSINHAPDCQLHQQACRWMSPPSWTFPAAMYALVRHRGDDARACIPKRTGRRMADQRF